MKKSLFYIVVFITLIGNTFAGTVGKRNIASDVTQTDSTAYYYGPVNYFINGTAHGGTFSLIKRTISPTDFNITEDLIQPPRLDGRTAFHDVTTIIRVDSTSTLIATDSLQSFVGKLTFVGSDWEWTGWTYQIRGIGGDLSGSTVEGTATLNSSGMNITKISNSQYKTQNGDLATIQVTIKEVEKVISQNQYEVCKAKLLATTSSKEDCQL